MFTKPQNTGKPWSVRDMQLLRSDIKRHTPTRMIAQHLKRTMDAVYAKASEMHLSLKHTSRMPRTARW